MKTKTILIAFLFNCFFISSYSQDTLNKLPEGWKLSENSNDYISGIENYKAENKNVGFLKSKSEIKKVSQFGVLSQVILARKYLGKRIRYSALVKSCELEKWAGLWIRVDGDEFRPISFDNMADRPIKGTTDWTKYDVVIDIPANSDKIYFGFIMSGNGKFYFEDLKFEIVDKTVSCTGKNFKQPPFFPQNLSFEIPSLESYEVCDYWNFYNKDKIYDISVINDTVRNGKVLFIEKDKEIIKSLAFVSQEIKSRNYWDNKIKISVYVKSENVVGEARLIVNINKIKNKFNYHRSENINGTNDWKKIEIITNVPANSKTINFGVFLLGTGKIWFDDFSFEVIEGTDKTKISDEPINLTF